MTGAQPRADYDHKAKQDLPSKVLTFPVRNLDYKLQLILIDVYNYKHSIPHLPSPCTTCVRLLKHSRAD